MKKIGIILLTLVWCIALLGVNIVEIKPDKKVVHVDQLGLSESASVRDALDMMPDLLKRNTENIIDDFSVQVDGQDVGNSADVILVQTILAEVDVIEVSTSPTVSDQKNGQGGVINIKMKEASEGFHGDALLDVSTALEVMPSVLMSFNKDKWSLNGSLMMEYLNVKNSTYTERQSPTSMLMATDSIHSRYRQETAKFGAKYQNNADELKIYVWESLAYSDQFIRCNMRQETPMDRPNIIRRVEGVDTSNIWNTRLNVVANVEYKHTFSNAGTVNASARYDYSPVNGSDNMIYDSQYYRDIVARVGLDKRFYQSSTRRAPHQFSTELKTKHEIGRWSENHYLEIEGGANYQLNATRLNDTELKERDGARADESTVTYSTITNYISPFVSFSYYYKRFTLQAGARYQYQTQTGGSEIVSKTGNNDTTLQYDSHDWIANINLNWEVAPHHNLRALASRNLMRPSVEQLSPIMYYNQKLDMHMQGNPDLTSTKVYNADIDYSFDFQNEKHNLLLDVGLCYIRTENPIEQVTCEEDKLYFTFENDYSAPANIMNLNLLLCYKVGVYSLFFTGNTFYRLQHKGEDIRSRLYYNVAMTNNFNFAKGWAMAFKLIYNSEEWAMNEIKGDCLYATLRLAKTWGHWLVHAEVGDIFEYITKDYSRNGDEKIMRCYDPYKQYVAVGFAYKW